MSLRWRYNANIEWSWSSWHAETYVRFMQDIGDQINTHVIHLESTGATVNELFIVLIG